MFALFVSDTWATGNRYDWVVVIRQANTVLVPQARTNKTSYLVTYSISASETLDADLKNKRIQDTQRVSNIQLEPETPAVIAFCGAVCPYVAAV